MTEYMTEQEQIELIKSWIKQYSLFVVLGVCLAAVAIYGWQIWQKHQNKTLYHASIIYDKMLSMRAQNDPVATIAQAKRLTSKYSQTIYGQIAMLTIARDAILKKDYLTAKNNLVSVIQKSKDATFRQIAKTRLARLLIEENKPSEALSALNKVDDSSFVGLINEIKGDAYLAMNKPQEARTAYQEALQAIPNAEVIRPVLQMKYDNLATQPTT